MGLQKGLAAAGCGLILNLVAGTALAEVVVVVSARSPVNALSGQALADIFLGRMTRLPSGEPVEPVDQAEDRPAREEFYTEYLGQTPAQVKAHWSRLIFTGRGRPPPTVPDGAAAAETVAENPNAIGYVEPSLVDERLRVVPIE